MKVEIDEEDLKQLLDAVASVRVRVEKVVGPSCYVLEYFGTEIDQELGV